MKSTLPVIEILRTASQALLRNWKRAVLTSLSMVVGTASLVLLRIAAISLIASGTNIMNIMLITVAERIREIGKKNPWEPIATCFCSNFSRKL
jgi:hypothetical protein